MTGLPMIAAAIAFLFAAPLHADETALPLLRKFVDELVAVTPGEGKFPSSFEMGSTADKSELPVHTVTLDSPFSIGRYEVPQNLYEAVMGENPSRWKGPRNAVEQMTWREAQTFCQRLTKLLRQAELIAADEVIRLPSETEWEYCCRAGTTTAYSFGDEATAESDAGNQASRLDRYGWHTGNAAGNDPPVGALQPNRWGLYDTHGYLREFTADSWHADYSDAPTNESARSVSTDDAHGAQVVVRGGSWKDHYRDLRSASRQAMAATARDDAVGFRCVKAKAAE